MFDRLTPAQETRFWQYEGMLKAHGYIIASEPIEGSEDLWLDDIKAATVKVEATAKWLRGRYGYRGLSNALKTMLATTLPDPSDNVTSDR